MYFSPIHVPANDRNPARLAVAVSITFNLALAYHAAAVALKSGFSDHANQEEVLLRQALQLYQYTFRLQRSHAASSHSPFFFMSCINNIGIVFSDLDDDGRSEECFGHLLSLLMYLATVRTLDLSRFNLFFDNSLHLSNARGVVCASAA